MLAGLLREENSPFLVDRKRKKDAKDNKRRDGTAPQLDRIPLPTVPASVVKERTHMQKEAQKKVCILFVCYNLFYLHFVSAEDQSK